ncbi:hypothetical protein MMF98_18375 [Variovorax sp. CYS-02]|uniref:Uncharacterized protein n=1 Tax=Variovorax terrae TaxID=2923278 RepID=A0A9X2APA0_9BURK|nr:hypothetical protein [Variovorax terrae]
MPEATANLATKQVKMEQWFQDNKNYYATGTTSTCAIGASDTTSSKYFSFSCVVSSTAATYTVTATGTGSMNGFVYTVTQDGSKATPGVPAKWTSSTNCWITKKGGVC